MECPICCDAIEVTKTGITTMACNHSFHFHCLAKWFNMQTEEQQTCPCCRREATELERQPVEEEFAEDSDSDMSEGDDEIDFEAAYVASIEAAFVASIEAAFVASIEAATTTQYTLTSSWVQQPNGTWVRKAQQQPQPQQP